MSTKNFIAPTASVLGDVTIGENSSIWYGAVVRADDAKIVIGTHTNIQDLSIVHPNRGVDMRIGDYVTIGHGAIIHCKSIGSNSVIGMGAILQDDVEIGDGCIVAPGAVVTQGKVIPPRSVVMGVPGKVVRSTTDEELEEIRQQAMRYCKKIGRYAESG